MPEALLLLPPGLPRLLALVVAAGILGLILARRVWVEALSEEAARPLPKASLSAVEAGEAHRASAPVERSLVVVARNEACRLPALLQDLEGLLEHDEALEILLADDASTDGSRQLMEVFTLNQRDRAVILLPADATRRGKPAWLRHAVAQCRGAVVLFSDADCRLPARWSLTMQALLGESNGGGASCVAAGGLVLLESCTEAGLAQQWQRMHWILLSACGAALCARRGGTQAPSLWGANMAFRRRAVDALGGYANLAAVDAGEDLHFVRSLRQKGAAVRLAAFPRESRVRTAPESWSGAARQLARWGASILRLGLFEQALVLGMLLWMLALAGILLMKPVLGILLVAVALMPLSALLDVLAACLGEEPAGVGGAALYLGAWPLLLMTALYHTLRGDAHWRRPE